jgi:putative endonuclease
MSDVAILIIKIYMGKIGYIYILASKRNWVLYIGVTNNLQRRIYEHKNELIKWFTQKYFVKKLVYYEEHPDITSAIQKEKQIKSWNRNSKILLIESLNPNRDDLYQNVA